MSKVRVRFAPSPTGPLHIGGVRTALFNYLFAKKHQGDFILRIEDTDQSRYVEEAEAYIMESLHWLGLSPDESPEYEKEFRPYRQSERKDIYQSYIPKILESGYAYYAFDTPEELEAKRKEYESKGAVFSYNAETRGQMNNSLGMSPEELEEKMRNRPNYVIRFKMPENEEIITQDIIRGTSKINTKELDDKVLVKADGMPTYHFANVIDDAQMQISHVIRGEEWLPSLPLHLLLNKALGFTPPQFAHLPLILKPEGNGKLSKRDGAKLGFPVFPIEWKEENETHLGFRELGYYPMAMNNFLAQLGWTPKSEEELLSMEELIEQFDLEKVHKAGARFDIKKAEHLNKLYFHSLSVNEIYPEYRISLSEWNIEPGDIEVERVIEVMKDRVSFLNELVSESLFFYESPMAFNENEIKKATSENTPQRLQELRGHLESNEFTAESLSSALKAFAQEKELGMGKVMMPVRLALVGEMKGPDVPVIMEILGKENSLKRLEYFEKFIQA